MKYRIAENYYGPEIRGNDWQAEEGELVHCGGTLQILAGKRARVWHTFYPKGGGGDVEMALAFDLEALQPGWRFVVHFNARTGPKSGNGFRLVINADGLKAFMKDKLICGTSAPRWVTGRAYELKLATLAEDYCLLLDGEPLAAGRMEFPFDDNEGRLLLEASGARLRLIRLAENFIEHDVEFPRWEPKALLYEEKFGEESFASGWVCNGEGPVCAADSFTFKKMSVSVLKERFEGPIAVESIATPMPTAQYSAGVTDAIFIWMIDKRGGGLFDYMRGLPDALLERYLPLPFYWMDFGGSNNMTTRLRKNPQRHMMRQFTDRARLLERGRTYRITTVQIDGFVEFRVDGECWVRAFDPNPLAEGHIGFRAFVSDMKVSGLKVWRIARC